MTSRLADSEQDPASDAALRATPDPAAPLDLDFRLIGAAVAVTLIVLFAALRRWRHTE